MTASQDTLPEAPAHERYWDAALDFLIRCKRAPQDRRDAQRGKEIVGAGGEGRADWSDAAGDRLRAVVGDLREDGEAVSPGLEVVEVRVGKLRLTAGSVTSQT